MSAYNPMRRGINLRSLGQRSYSVPQIISSVFGFIIAVGVITVGAVLLGDESTIEKMDKGKTSTFNTVMAYICIVMGSLVILYGLWKFLTKA